jgi:hypothetical protein
MLSCAAVGNRRRPIDNRPQLNKLPYKESGVVTAFIVASRIIPALIIARIIPALVIAARIVPALIVPGRIIPSLVVAVIPAIVGAGGMDPRLAVASAPHGLNVVVTDIRFVRHGSSFEHRTK